MRAAVICGDRWHPAEVIRVGITPLIGDDVALDFVIDTSDWSRERLGQYDVLMLARDNAWQTEATRQDIHNFVTEGGGLLVLHSGTVGFKEQPEFHALIGGVFLHHPHPCPVTLEYSGDFGLEEHDPQTIEVHDEHYFVETMGELDVFLHSVSENGTQPAGWLRAERNGRVCVLTPGHYQEVWQHPTYQHTLRQALNWSAA